MSQFQDNFKRDKEEDMLEYDDSAFYYFSLALLAMAAVPLTLHVLRLIIQGGAGLDASLANCKCEPCADKFSSRSSALRAKAYNKGLFLKVIVMMSLWYLTYLNVETVNAIETIQSFDPFVVLDLPSDADDKAIKRAYRRLSLLKHPDKNPDDPLAVQEFIKLTKAYRILTDEEAKENFRKYGNPDGPGSYHVAIALPRALLERDNQVLVLGAAFFVLIIVIPAFFYASLDSSSKGEGGISLDNRKVYGTLINENMLMKNMPQMLSKSLEFVNIPSKSSKETQLLKKIREIPELAELIPKAPVTRRNKAQGGENQKGIVMILAHLLQAPQLEDPLFEEGRHFILTMAPFHVEMMIRMGMELMGMAQQGRSLKRVTAKNILMMIDFSQQFVQGLWAPKDTLMQLPHFDAAVIKKYKQAIRIEGIPDAGIETFCRLPAQQRAKLNLFDGDHQKAKDVEDAIKVMPVMSVESTIEVVGDDEIVAGDFVTVKVTATLDNVKEGEEPGYVHSNNYPYLKRCHYYVLITDAQQTMVFDMERVTPHGNTVVKEIKQRFARAGTFNLRAVVKCDSYLGFEKEATIAFTVAESSTKRVVAEYAAEDLAAVKGPGLVQGMLDIGEDQSSSEEEEDATMDAKKLIEAKLKKSGISDALQKRRQANEDENQLLVDENESKKDK